MKKLLFYILFFSCFYNCSTHQVIQLNDQTVKIYRPPNTTEIKENFYADISEVVNIDYKEYLFWLKQVHGEDSKIYNNALPDMSVWRTGSTFVDLDTTYFRYKKYDTHPVVGISYQQAEKYTKWRTNRVAEMILINEKLVKIFPKQNPENYFTIERYATGNYEWHIKKENIALPKYSIPSEKEWILIAKANMNNLSGTDKTSKYNQNILKTRKAFFNTFDFFKSENNIDGYLDDKRPILKYCTAPVKSFSKNNFGLFDIIGNVSEFVSEKNISKGGSWKHKMEQCNIDQSIPLEAPNCWTGLRNVCRWEMVKVK